MARAIKKVKVGERIFLVGRRKYLLTAKKDTFSTQYGEIDLGKIIRKPFGSKVKTHLGEEFQVFEPRRVDLLKKIKRAPQIITFKDSGIIAAYTGLGKEDVVVEAGSGSGALTIFLAGIVKEVHAYEIREDFHNIVKKNLEQCGCDNVILKNKDVAACKERDVDVFILDMGSPEEHIETARKALKPGGFLVVYSPVVEQVQRVYERLSGFVEVETIEASVREWDIGQNKTRPKSQRIGHTGFLTFGRKG